LPIGEAGHEDEIYKKHADIAAMWRKAIDMATKSTKPEVKNALLISAGSNGLRV
jgi:hypothetical protein